ncbi:MAG: CsbD family protein [Oxalobacteraceae bacterium]|nr:MAG: CsbD family protein [Oxalobacteraceae bacterium]
MVDDNRITGSLKQAGGSLKETAGRMTGDRKLQNEGILDKAKGKIENAVGSVKDTIRDALGSKTDTPRRTI